MKRENEVFPVDTHRCTDEERKNEETYCAFPYFNTKRRSKL